MAGLARLALLAELAKLARLAKLAGMAGVTMCIVVSATVFVMAELSGKVELAELISSRDMQSGNTLVEWCQAT